MRKNYFALAIILLIATLTVQSQTLEDMSFGKGLINFTAKDSTFSVKFAPRFQLLSSTKWSSLLY